MERNIAMYRSNALIFLIMLSMAAPVAQARVTPPEMSMKDQTIHADPFVDMLIQICKEKRPNDWEKCVESFKRLENLGKYRSKNRKKCGYLIIEEMPRYRPCF